MRVNSSLLGVCIVDAWLLYKGGKGSRATMSQMEFYSKLAEGLIDNRFDEFGLRSRPDVVMPSEDEHLISGIKAHLTPTTRKRKRSDGSVTNSCYQGRCTVCKSTFKSKYICSECRDVKKKEFWLCHAHTGRKCFEKHLEEVHFMRK